MILSDCDLRNLLLYCRYSRRIPQLTCLRTGDGCVEEGMSDSRIILGHEDYTVLKGLVDSLTRAGKLGQPHFDRLAREMKEAVVVDRDAIPPKVITMGSRVNYTCLETGTTDEVVLVFPAQAKNGEKYISILAPVGLALVGEREGTDVEYIAPGGTYHIRINKVVQTQTHVQPASAR